MSTALPSFLKALHASVTAPRHYAPAMSNKRLPTSMRYSNDLWPYSPGKHHFKHLDKTFDSLRLIGQAIVASPLNWGGVKRRALAFACASFIFHWFTLACPKLLEQNTGPKVNATLGGSLLHRCGILSVCYVMDDLKYSFAAFRSGLTKWSS